MFLTYVRRHLPIAISGVLCLHPLQPRRLTTTLTLTTTDRTGTTRRTRDRHGRRTRTATTGSAQTGPRTTTSPRHTLGPPKTVPMTPQQYEQAIRAWAILIASWWTDHPPDE